MDKNGKAVHVGDRIRLPNGEEHTVGGVGNKHGFIGAPSIAHASFVAFARDVEVIEKGTETLGAPAHWLAATQSGDQSIVWGNGQ